MSISLKVGRIYRTNNGLFVEIVHHYPSNNLFLGDNGLAYSADGSSIINSSKDDLVYETITDLVF